MNIGNYHFGIRDHHVGVDCQLSLKWGLLNSWMFNRTNQTHVEDVKNPEEFPIPTGNIVLIALCEHEPRKRIPFTLLPDLLLDLGHGSATGTSVNGLR
jgi:hypothetical protein